jgi:hypothetical protein
MLTRPALGQDADSILANCHYLVFMSDFNDSAKLEFYSDSADVNYKWADSFFLQTNESIGGCFTGSHFFWPQYKNAYILVTIKHKNLSLRIPLKENDAKKFLYVYKERDLLYAVRDSKLWRLE